MSKVRSLFALFTGASAAALTLAAPAQAQDTPATSADEIVVTASKRSQTLLDVPISVAVTTAAAIEQANVRDLLDLQSLVPSLRVGQLQSSANTNFIIRGFGNGANNAGIEPAVGVFIDGVYRSRSAAQISDLPNIERVEVLRGPQSTLFGKNASAGVISVVTQEPQFEPGGGLEASYGNYNAVVLKGDFTGPITDKIAYSIGGSFNKRDGYSEYVNLAAKGNDRNRSGIRGQLLIVPNDDLKLRFIADYDKIDEICCTVANVVAGPTAAAIRAIGGNILSNQPTAYKSYANFPSLNNFMNSGVSGQADWQVSPTLALTSITAYRQVRGKTNADSDFTSADLIGENSSKTDINTFTQEIRLASKFDGPLNFLVGGFYFNEDIDTGGQLTFGRDFKNYANALTGGAYSSLEPTLRALVPGIPAGTFGGQGQGRFENYTLKNEAVTLFGQVDFEITKKLSFTGGLSWTNDKKNATTKVITTDTFSTIDLVQAGANAGVPGPFRTTSANPFLALRGLQFIPPFLNFPNSVESGRVEDTNTSHTLRLAYKFSDDLNVYVTHATGFKGSSFNLSIDSRPFPRDFIPGSPFQVPSPAASAIRTAGLAVTNLTSGTRYAEPEDADVWEIGAKMKFDTVRINIAAFKQSIKGFQSNIFTGTGFVLGNAEEQSTTGVEVESSWSPTPNLDLTAAVTYLDPKFDKFTGGTALNSSFSTVPTNLTGKKPSGIPDYSATFGATYAQPLSSDRQIVYHVDYNYQKPYITALGLPIKSSPETLNASIALGLENGLELSIWGRNLTEPKYNTTLFPSVAQAGSLSGYPSPPATYGATARLKF